MHLPRDIGKRNAEERATGACDLGDAPTTTGGFCLHCASARSTILAAPRALVRLIDARGTATGTCLNNIALFLKHKSRGLYFQISN